MFEYQKWSTFFCQVAGGLEQIACDELKELGCKNTKTRFRLITFEGDLSTMYRVNYCARLCTRVLAPLLTFDCHSAKYLYKTAMKIEWSQLLDVHNTFAIFASVSHSSIKHSQYAALTVKDAIADWFVREKGERPSVDTEKPDVWFNVHIQNNRAVISIDTSGGSLHRRGYRRFSVEATMQETVAASIIRLSQWDGSKPLFDPLCGSGTILCEALMHYCSIPAAYLRSAFGFMHLPDYDAKQWLAMKKTIDAGIRSLPPGHISGSDCSPIAVDAARSNSNLLPYGSQIFIEKRRFQDITRISNQCIITNPPYGVRLGTELSVEKLYKEFGVFLSRKAPNSSVFLYSAHKGLEKSIPYRYLWKQPLINGALEGMLYAYSTLKE